MQETLKILLVDDDAVDRMAVRRALKSAGVQATIVEAEDCATAIALLGQQSFDCTILDYRLPDGDGLFLTHQLRQTGITVPLIVLTGQGDEQVAVELMRAGVYDYFSKNKLSPDRLSHSLLNAVRVHRAEIQAAEATRQLRDSEERYRLVLEGSNDGIWDWYICQNEVYCNDRLFEIIGMSREELGNAEEAFYRLIHPDDRQRVLGAIADHLEQRIAFDVEFQLWNTSGGYRYCASRGKAQRDEQGNLFRMSGIVSDITLRKQAEAEVAKLNQSLERHATDLQTLFDVIPIGIAIADDPNCQHVRVNPAYADILGIPLEANASVIAPDVEHQPYKFCRDGQETPLEQLPMQIAATQQLKVLDTEFDIVRDDGRVINILGYTTPLFDEQENSRGCIGAFVDITERKRAEAAQRFLAEASSVLASSLNAATILSQLAKLCVPFLADLCFFDLVNDRDDIQRIAWQHADPTQQDWFAQVQQYVPTLDSKTFINTCLATGESVFVPDVSDAWLQATAMNSSQLQFMRELNLASLITVSLTVHDRELGTLTFCQTTQSKRRYTEADLRLVEDLAQRTALAVDNAELYHTTQHTEQNLRRALIILGQHQQQLRTLQSLTDLLNRRLTNLPELLQVMVSAICDAIPSAEFGVIVLQNPYTGLLEVTADTGGGVETLHLEASFAPGEGLLGEIFSTGQARLVQVGGDGDASASLYAVAIESPQAGRLGVLAIGNHYDSAAFDGDNVQLLNAFAEQAAIALTNAQLINALEESEERLATQNQILGEQNQKLEQQQQQIQLQNIRLQEAAKLKSQFIATMSHELRTPMNAVLGFSQLLLRQKQLTPLQTDMMERIVSNGKNLLTLINDILDLSKIEAGRLELKLEDMNLAHLIVTTTEELRSLADQKNLTLQVNLTLSDPHIINDNTRLRQVLVNLLSNAIKFTDNGSVTVEATEVGDNLVLTVQDTGMGIAKEDISHIFEVFRQVDQTLTKKPGTGLGLAITDLLVNLMNGNITVESELGRGSTFRVEFPRVVKA